MAKRTELWIPVIIRKITLLSFILGSLVFVTFIIGNFQEFLDSTQIILLSIFELLAVIFIILDSYHFIFTVFGIVKKKSSRTRIAKRGFGIAKRGY